LPRRTDLVPAVTPAAQALVEVYFTDRYPGFDLDDPDWPMLRQRVEEVANLLAQMKARLPGMGS